MAAEILILDMDDTLKNEEGCFDGVGEFLERQSLKRDCVIATYRCGSISIDENIEMIQIEFGKLSRHITALYPREIIAQADDYHRVPDGRIFHKTVASDSPSDLTGRTLYKNPFIKIPHEKDLYLVRSLHAQRKKMSLPKSVFVGDYHDIQCGCTDLETPAFIVNDPLWVRRKKVESLLDRLFINTPGSVFDNFYATGNQIPDVYLPAPIWMDKDGYTLGESVEVKIDDADFRMSRSLNGKAIRLIEELI